MWFPTMILSHGFCLLLIVSWATEAQLCIKCWKNDIKRKIFPRNKCSYDGYTGNDQTDSISDSDTGDRYKNDPCAGGLLRPKSLPEVSQSLDAESEDDRGNRFGLGYKETVINGYKGPYNKPQVGLGQLNYNYNTPSPHESSEWNNDVESSEEKNQFGVGFEQSKITLGSGNNRKPGFGYQESQSELKIEDVQCSKNPKSPCRSKKKQKALKDSGNNMKSGFELHESHLEFNSEDKKCSKNPKSCSTKKKSKIPKGPAFESNDFKLTVNTEDGSQKKSIVPEYQGNMISGSEFHESHLEFNSEDKKCAKNPKRCSNKKKGKMPKGPGFESNDFKLTVNTDNGIQKKPTVSEYQGNKIPGFEFHESHLEFNSEDKKCAKNPKSCSNNKRGKISKVPGFESNDFKLTVNSEDGSQMKPTVSEDLGYKIPGSEFHGSHFELNSQGINKNSRIPGSEFHESHFEVNSQGISKNSTMVKIPSDNSNLKIETHESHFDYNRENGSSTLLKGQSNNMIPGFKSLESQVGVNSETEESEDQDNEISESESDEDNSEDEECSKNSKGPCKRKLRTPKGTRNRMKPGFGSQYNQAKTKKKNKKGRAPRPDHNTALISVGVETSIDLICKQNPCDDQCRDEGNRAVCVCNFGSVVCQPGNCIVDQHCEDHLSCIDGQCVDLCPKSCGSNTFCKMKNHKPVCECLLGYRGNPHVECNNHEICSPNPCGANTACKSVEGKPVCLCLPGYEGDPMKGCKHECEHDSECAKNQACMEFTCQDACKLCGKYADCDGVSVHKPICKCPANYFGNPYVSCQPECTDHGDCPKNKPNCHQFKCRNPCDGACGAQANCEINGFEAACSCPEDLTGNPLVLCRPYERKDFCEPFPCGKHSKCELGVDDHGKYMAVCNCLPGYYKRNDGVCIHGECADDTHCPDHKACLDFVCDDPCIGECGSNSICETHNHTAVCSCNSGYEGNPVLGCTKQVKCITKTLCSGRFGKKLLQGK